jgi:hypothetical protein
LKVFGNVLKVLGNALKVLGNALKVPGNALKVLGISWSASPLAGDQSPGSELRRLKPASKPPPDRQREAGFIQRNS